MFENYWTKKVIVKNKLILGTSASGLELTLSGYVETSFLAILIAFSPFPRFTRFSYFSLRVGSTFGLCAIFMVPTPPFVGFFFLVWVSGEEFSMGMALIGHHPGHRRKIK